MFYHPHSQIKYCSICGSPLAPLLLPTEDRERLVCGSCGYIHYLNPRVVSGAIPLENGRIWLLRRAIEPRLGAWTYPAGYQEIDETTEGAALREAHEELGCSIVLDRLVGVYSRAHSSVVNVVYAAHLDLESGRPGPTKEALEVRAFRPGEIPWDDLAFPSTHLALRDWLQHERSRQVLPEEPLLGSS